MAQRHFHERVGESPRREKNFGTSGYKIRRFVSEICVRLKLEFVLEQISLCRIWALLNGHNYEQIYKGLNSSDMPYHPRCEFFTA